MSDRPTDERRAHLRLVPGADRAEPDPRLAPADELDDVSEDELRAAEALRVALEPGEPGESGLDALRAAFSPAMLSQEVHERMIERALGARVGGDGSARVALPEALLAPEPSRAEERAAAALRARVDAGLTPDPDAEPDDEIERLVEVAIALRSAHAPRELDELTETRIRKSALASPRSRRRAFATAIAALAVAAAAAFAVIPRVAPGVAPQTAALVPARSTQDLFDPAEPFPREGGTSARIDRISTSRSADLRHNRFARWGVK